MPANSSEEAWVGGVRGKLTKEMVKCQSFCFKASGEYLLIVFLFEPKNNNKMNLNACAEPQTILEVVKTFFSSQTERYVPICQSSAWISTVKGCESLL